eukprot:m.34076 g.34076  ORF g.34076 m.34076 type:complete len:525 (+) comp12273_c0_seq1:81-1655(+)
MAAVATLPLVDPVVADVAEPSPAPTTPPAIASQPKPKLKLKAAASAKSLFKRMRTWWLSQKQNFRNRRDELHRRCFWLTYLAHVCAYMLRKPLSLIKLDMAHFSGLTVPQMGWMDVALLLPLALLQPFAAQLGAQQGPRIVIAACLFGSAIVMSLFGLVNSYAVMLLLLMFNGAFQALLMPFCVKALSSWHAGTGQDLNFGIWGSSMFVGLSLATASSHATRKSLGWQHSFVVPVLLSLALAGLVFKFLRMPSGTTSGTSKHSTSLLGLGGERPAVLRGEGFVGLEQGAGTDSESEQEMEVYTIETSQHSARKGVLEVLRLPYVLQLSLAYMGINALRYSLHMWLPLYFHEQLGYSRLSAGYFSTLYELGGVVGSVALGLLSDSFFGGRRVAACQTALSVAIAAVILLYLTRHFGLFFNCLFLILLGAGGGGTDVIISTSLAIDIGQKADCVASVAGVIGGVGIFGAVMQGPLVAIMARQHGASGVLSVMVAIAALSVYAVSRARGLDSRRSIDAARLERKAAQ